MRTYGDLSLEPFLDLLSRHLVSFVFETKAHGTAGLPLPGGKRSIGLSGFVLAYRGGWAWVTAGHILEDLNSLLQSGEKIDNGRLVDTWWKTSKPAIPFTYNPNAVFFDNSDREFDWGIHVLSANTRDLLFAGGVVPIQIDRWREIGWDFEFVFVLGLPSVYEKEFGCLTPTLVPLAPPGTLPKDLLTRHHPLTLYGKLPDRSAVSAIEAKAIEDPDGLSGSPVFGWKRIKGKWDYCIVGVEFSVEKSSNVLLATPTSIIGATIERLWAEGIFISPKEIKHRETEIAELLKGD